MRILSDSLLDKKDAEVNVQGWVQSRRDHGGLIFVDLRDHKGLVQLVFNPDKPEVFQLAESLRDEFVISVTGQVSERGEGLSNPNIASGSIEIVASDMTILNKSLPLPIQPFSEQQASEELRLKYRYLDLRRPGMQTMLRQRSDYYKVIRNYMDELDFTEVTTPILANSSPEGARDFLVPSRVHPGKFYALPQAPQQFKQLLMVGGIDKYYQIATCFRDEDPRADRLYGDFYQLDLEMSFVDDGEVVRSKMEPLVKNLVTSFAGKQLMTDEVPRISYQAAMETYGSDKPDLRYDMKLVELTDVFASTEFAVFKNAETIKAICVEGGAELSRKQIDKYTEIAKSEGAGGLAYLTYTDGEVKSPIAKFMSETELSEVQQRLGAKDGDIIFFGADKRATVNKVLGRLRSDFGDHFNLKDPNVVALAWIVDFPFYEWDETNRRVDFGHNPFSMPSGGVEALRAAKTDEDKLAIVADQYDMVMNGYEICSGAVRNHNPEVMYEAFGALGYERDYVEAKFGAMLEAFKFGAPPHAGCAFGIDRIFMVLVNQTNIREVVAFPKNGSGVDVMMSSPSTVDPTQLDDLSLRLHEN
ncbi:MAG: aspartate--tRNA ligase [bacterium]|nr:aspartate--tRNA ligase [bacterium]